MFQKPREMHGAKWSGQARVSGGLQKQPLADAFAGAIATVFFSNLQTWHSVHFSPGKKVDIHMRNLEQFRVLQSLMEDGILSRDL